ncbi:MAG: two-component system sensor kinase FixL [Alphaproteobacteria bacterium]|jgi:two-component system sensor kinase FixL
MDQSKKLTLAQLLSNKDSNEQVFKDASAQLIAMLNATPDAFIIIDQSGTIELVNAATESMFLYSSQELLGKNISMLMPKTIKSAHNGYLAAYIKTGKTNIIGKGRKLQAVKSNGQEFPIFLSVGEVKHSSHTQFVGMISDISEQVKYQAALAQSQEKLEQATRLSSMGELAAGIAHEINQPLAAISSYAQASMRMINSPEIDHTKTITETLDKICEQALRANEVINRLRSLVKRHAAQRQKVDLYPLIHDTVNLAKIDTRMLEHEIELDLEESHPIELFVDPIQIQQVLLNLIRNAVDAMEQVKGMPLQIHCRWISAKEIEVSVLDFGKGIDAAASISIFAPFFTTKDSGMGMGLSVCQTIIHAHGGRIYYSSREPKGTVFTFSLPVFNENKNGVEK